MHGRITARSVGLDGLAVEDIGGGFTVASRVILTAAHVVEERPSHSLRFEWEADGEQHASRIDKIIIGSLDVAALLTVEEIDSPETLTQPLTGQAWHVQYRQDPTGPTVLGTVASAQREFQLQSGEQCVTHELTLTPGIEDLRGYSGSAMCVGLNGATPVAGLLLEAPDSRIWKMIIGRIRVPSGRVFAIDIFQALRALPTSAEMTKALSGIPLTHKDLVQAMARTKNAPLVRSERIPFVDSATSDVSVFLESLGWQAEFASTVKALDTQCREAGIRALPPRQDKLVRRAIESPIRISEAKAVIDTLEIESHVKSQLQRVQSKRVRESVWLTARKLARLGFTPAGMVLGVAGPFGSGKSRVAEEAARHMKNLGGPCIELSPFLGESFIEHLVPRLCKSLGVEGADLTGLAQLSSRLRVPTLIIVDDVDLGTYRDPERTFRLLDAIEESSRIVGVHWLLTSDDSRFVAMLPTKGQDIWSIYGFPFSRSARRGPAPGWIDLEGENGDHHVGIDILGNARPDAIEDLKNLDADAISLLSSPLAAWTRAETDRDLPPSSLNRLEFAQRYQDEILTQCDRLYQSSSKVAETNQVAAAIKAIARHVATSGHDSFHLEAVTEFGGLTSQDFAKAINLLVGLRVLRENVTELGIELHLAVPAFWAHQVFGHITRGIKPQSWDGWLEITRPWLKNESILADGVQVHVFTSARPSSPTHDAFLWETWGASPLTRPSAYLEAALPYQDETIEGVRLVAQPDRMMGSEQDRQKCLFSLLRYVAHPSCDRLAAVKRLRLVSDFFEDIRVLGLSDYFVYASERIIVEGVNSGDEFRLIIEELLGCESSGAHGPLGRIIGQQFVRRSANSAQVIRRLDRLASSKRVTNEMNDTRYSRSGERFLDVIIDSTADSFAQRYGLDGLTMLLKRDMLGLGYKHDVFYDTFRKYIALAYGYHSFRRGPSEDQTAYIDIVNLLVKGRFPGRPGKQRTLAFFLIRHSVSTNHQLAIRVDKAFYPALEVLKSDESLGGRFRSYSDPMFAANKIRADRFALGR